LRKLLNTPKAVEKVSPQAAQVIKYANLLLLGFRIDLDELPVDIVNGIEYFGMRRRALEKEEEMKFLARSMGAK
jgi:hypothetical protein